MSELTAFGYRRGTGQLYMLDSRVKLVSFLLISLSVLKASPLPLAVLTLGLIGLIQTVRLSFFSVIREIRYIGLLLLLILIVRAVSVSGFVSMGWKAVSISRHGLYDGGVICWRLILVILSGLLYVATTKSSEIKAAVEWMLTPFPFVPRKRLATMMGLTMRFVPVILNQARETIDAQRARGIEHRKNPFYRVSMLTIPLFRRTFQDAEKLALAMEARCYGDNRTGPSFSAGPKDWGILFGVAVCCFILVIL